MELGMKPALVNFHLKNANVVEAWKPLIDRGNSLPYVLGKIAALA
jgi:hypothetical protein